MRTSKKINFIPVPGSCVLWVKSKTPWYAPRFLVRKKIREAVGEYKALSGLMMKFFTINDDGTFGGLYFWKDAVSRETFYSPQRVAEITKKRGAEPKIVRLGLKQAWVRSSEVSGYDDVLGFWGGCWHLSVTEGKLTASNYSELQKTASVVGIFNMEEEKTGKAFYAVLSDDLAKLSEPGASEVPVIILSSNSEKS